MHANKNRRFPQYLLFFDKSGNLSKNAVRMVYLLMSAASKRKLLVILNWKVRKTIPFANNLKFYLEISKWGYISSSLIFVNQSADVPFTFRKIQFF